MRHCSGWAGWREGTAGWDVLRAVSVRRVVQRRLGRSRGVRGWSAGFCGVQLNVDDGSIRRMNPRELREYSPVTWVLERTFFCLQWLSIATLLLNSRINVQARFDDEAVRTQITKKRGRRVEAYVTAWIAAEALTVYLVNPSSQAWVTACTAIAAYRICDIVQAVMNLNLFDRLRARQPTLYVATIARTTILSVWNFFEAAICFGIIYASHPGSFKEPTDSLGAYYFSLITQLTIGYGDIFPVGGMRAVAMAQGAVGFILGLFAISRMVSFLPKTPSVLGDE